MKEKKTLHDIKCVTCEYEFQELCTDKEAKDMECRCCNNGEHTYQWDDAVNISDEYVTCEGTCLECNKELEGEFCLNDVSEL